jgi:hypothetical protein
MTLQRLIITFKSEEIVMHALYKTRDRPGPNTKARRREVEELTRSGLERALEGGAECVGTSGFTTTEDVLLASASLGSASPAKGGPWDP